MKKLSLKKLKLESTDLLHRNELKSVFGGYGGYQQQQQQQQQPYCYNIVEYDDGYTYSSNQGASVADCQALEGTRYENLGGFGPAEVIDCHCTSA